MADWRLKSPAFILGDPSTYLGETRMSDYSVADEATTVMVFQPADPEANGQNGRALTDRVFEVNVEGTEVLPVANDEQRAQALRMVPQYRNVTVLRGHRPSIVAPKRMRAEAMAEAAADKAVNDAWAEAIKIEVGSPVRLRASMRKFKDRRAISEAEVGRVFWKGYERSRYSQLDSPRYGVEFDGVSIFRNGYDFVVENPADEMPDYQEMVEAAYGLAYQEAMETLEDDPMMFSWSNAKPVGHDQTAYYDIGVYDVPFTGAYDGMAASSQLNANVSKLAAANGKFGGYSSYNVKGDNGDGTFRVEQLYHIGD